MIIESSNHWWQNCPKTHAYVAQKMFFPKSAEEIASVYELPERCPVSTSLEALISYQQGETAP